MRKKIRNSEPLPPEEISYFEVPAHGNRRASSINLSDYDKVQDEIDSLRAAGDPDSLAIAENMNQFQWYNSIPVAEMAPAVREEIRSMSARKQVR
jgi:hypothetical protein